MEYCETPHRYRSTHYPSGHVREESFTPAQIDGVAYRLYGRIDPTRPQRWVLEWLIEHWNLLGHGDYLYELI